MYAKKYYITTSRCKNNLKIFVLFRYMCCNLWVSMFKLVVLVKKVVNTLLDTCIWCIIVYCMLKSAV